MAAILAVSTKAASVRLAGLARGAAHLPQLRGKLALPRGLGPLQHAHRHYLSRRGLRPRQTAELWQLQGLGLDAPGGLRWRIFIPIIQNREIVSWTTRAIGELIGPKYRTAAANQEAISHKEVLYGADYTNNSCIVVEGPGDSWSVGPGAVATLGLGYSQAQVLALSKYPIRAICFDNEKEALKRARRLFSELEAFPGQTFIVTLDAKDPGSAKESELKELRIRFLENHGRW